jgi:hypothetical protein
VDSGGARGDAELGEDRSDVGVDGPLAEAQPVGDSGVGKAQPEQLQDFKLPIGKTDLPPVERDCELVDHLLGQLERLGGAEPSSAGVCLVQALSPSPKRTVRTAWS